MQDLLVCPVDARKTHYEVITQTPDRVVGAPRLNHAQGQVGEARQLCRQEVADERLVHLDFVVVHAYRHVSSFTDLRRRVERFKAPEERSALPRDVCPVPQQ